MKNKECQDWNPLKELNVMPKVLLIGHDPGLQSSKDFAKYALYAHYYFQEKPKSGPEKSKYNLAASSFKQVLEVTNHKYHADEIYVTNLCNLDLTDGGENRPEKKTILIPEKIAQKGVERLNEIIAQYDTIEYVFPMSEQVNYWLHYFNFYQSGTDFVEKAKPKENGLKSNPPYYEHSKPKGFLDICGKCYELNSNKNIKVIPILHTKQYSKIAAYIPAYENIKSMF